jgi:histidine ammonia-lyase
MQEDHNSMGWSAGLKLRKVLENLGRILAIEALCAAQALELRTPLRSAPATGAVVKRIRREVPFMEKDRFLVPDLRRAEELVRSGELARSAGEEIGTLE